MESRDRINDPPSSVDDTLRVLSELLAGRRFIVASNREPYIHRKAKGGLICDQPAGGVTAVLDPVLRATNGVWVAWGSGDADRETVDDHDRIRVPPEDSSYTLRRVWLNADDVKDYYHGYANRFLWPLCHMTLDRVMFRQRYWEAYRRVNERFAKAILEELDGQQGVVWIHDYQLALCPLYLKQQRPDLMVSLFWHIPWPAHDVFRICPQRRDLLLALLSCDLLGFHLDRYRQNFLECVEREQDAKVEAERDAVMLDGHRTVVSAFPVSIDFHSFDQLARSSETEKRMVAVGKRFQIGPDFVVGLGVDRLDYTKGLLKRLLAIDEFLSRYPEFHGRFIFLQVAAPTRAESEPYRSYRDLLHSTVREINERFGRDGWKPIEFIEGQLSQKVLSAYYRLADFCLVSSVYDGMNLVSKEYVASRVDESGVLVLSEMAGSLEELEAALPINPYDIEAIAATLRQAITMPKEEQRSRMARMRAYIKRHDIYRWMKDNFEAMVKVRS